LCIDIRHTHAELVSPSAVAILSYSPLKDLHSFPTRRSSDLMPQKRKTRRSFMGWELARLVSRAGGPSRVCRGFPARDTNLASSQDRKSTRLNSSHDQIAHAVPCVKKNQPLEIRHGHQVGALR